MLNQSAEYALRVVTLIAGRRADRPSHAAALAKELGVPANYLSKILHQLAAAGVLTSRRGRGGGFRLADAPGDLTLATVVAPFDALATYRTCLLGKPVCGDRHACAAHVYWKPIAVSVLRFLQETTVRSLASAGPRGASPPISRRAGSPGSRGRRSRSGSSKSRSK